jgi:DNA-binding HxlR family transcriptional regulator
LVKRKRGYGQFCPVAKASEVIAERWIPLVLRELLGGSQRFGELRRGIPLISSTMLSQRLRDLETAGVLTKRRDRRDAGWEYRLTPAGRSLRPIIEQLGVWGQQWAQHEIAREDRDPRFLMWAMHRQLTLAVAPGSRRVIEFELRKVTARQRRWWMVVGPEGVDLCLKPPGYQVDLRVVSDVEVLARVYLGRLEARAAVAAGDITLTGEAALARSFPRWCPRSKFAGVQPTTEAAL